MFCVECGKEGETYDGLCASCHLARRHFVSLPEIVDVQVCSSCFAARIGKNWVDAISIEDAIRRTIVASLEKEKSVTEAEIILSLRERDTRNYLADATVKFTTGNFTAEKSFQINVRLKRDTCQRCGKKSGHYYEAIIQLRGPHEGSKRVLAAREDVVSRVDKLGAKSRSVFISKEERMHGGYDFYLSSASVAKALAKDLSDRFGATSKISSSLVGKKDGKELVRMTYLVRLPEYEAGDILLVDKRLYLLRSIEGNTLWLTDLSNWQDSATTLGRLSEIEIARHAGEILEAQVISDKEGELQILDPEDNCPVEVVKPKRFAGRTGVVRIVKTKNGILLVP
jgi:nonsense-mediated mRNA decay protein 3